MMESTDLGELQAWFNRFGDVPRVIALLSPT
jgi:hypothetical protein